ARTDRQGRRGHRHQRQGPRQAGQGPARRSALGARLRRGPEHHQAPHTGARRHHGGGRRDRAGGPDPPLERRAARPEGQEGHARQDRRRERQAAARVGPNRSEVL
ncbi:MAG: LSU ribosomal protein L24p (L26e), partial [uncultured Solirubrobacteraceae bacterium]